MIITREKKGGYYINLKNAKRDKGKETCREKWRYKKGGMRALLSVAGVRLQDGDYVLATTVPEPTVVVLRMKYQFYPSYCMGSGFGPILLDLYHDSKPFQSKKGAIFKLKTKNENLFYLSFCYAPFLYFQNNNITSKSPGI